MVILKTIALRVAVGRHLILKGVDIEVKGGEIVALMGPNGSGKSTLAFTLMGHPRYRVIDGAIFLDGESIVNLRPEERAKRGIFLAFQSPPEIKGVKVRSLLSEILEKRFGEASGKDYEAVIAGALSSVGLSAEHLEREAHRGFSGGERKRLEVAQAIVLEPKILILDEPDSGLDVEGVRLLAKKISNLRDNGAGVLLITHYPRMLRHLDVDRVYVLVDGRIAASGGPELAFEVEEKGYEVIVR